MKASVVFVVLALCCFAGAKVTVPQFRDNKLRDSNQKKFYPAELPCEYTLDFIVDDGELTTGTISFAGGHEAVHMTIDDGDSVTNTTYIVRSDILEDSYYVVEATLNDDKECEAEKTYYRNTYAYNNFDHYRSAQNYYTLERNQEWNGIRCNLYTYGYYYRFCVDADKHIVGLYYYGTNYTFYNYRMEANKDDFIVPTEYTGCSNFEELYEEPNPFPGCDESSSDDSSSSSDESDSSYSDEDFEPAKLPCSYTVDFIVEEGDSVTQGTLSFAGKYEALNMSTNYNGTITNQSYIVRFDIKNNGGYVAQAVFNDTTPDTTQCEVKFVSTSSSGTYGRSLSEFFTYSYPYDTITRNQTWKGIECDMYSYDEWLFFCVDDGDHLIGVNFIGTNYTFYNYRMEANENDFILPRKYTGCSDYEKLYEKPDPFPDCYEKGYFVHTELPCVYTVDFIIESSDSVIQGTSSFGGGYEAVNRTSYSNGITFSESYIARPDIKFGGKRVMQAKFNDTTQCNADFVFRDDTAGSFVSMFLTHDSYYEKVERNYTWRGFKCDLYHSLDDILSFCVDGDGHYIGVMFDSVNYTFYNYRMEANEDDFIVPRKYTGCSDYEKLYEKPDPFPECFDDDSSDIWDGPTELPCAYTVYYKMCSDSSVTEGIYSVYGEYAALTSWDYSTNLSSSSSSSVDSEVVTLIQRPDVTDTYLVARVKLDPEDKSCDADFVDPDDNLKSIDALEYLEFASWCDDYIVLRNKEWDGIKCDMYYCDESYLDFSFCVDADGLIVGMDLTELFGKNFTFRFRKTEPNDFVVPSEYTGCSSYKKLYEAPDPDPDCSLSGSSSSSSSRQSSTEPVESPSSASTVKAFTTIVFAMVLSTLLSLFY